ncbi:MAG TPA: hypothetical protein VEH77_14935 [Roseiarcus sp.]|nr:hypothetical protein [Roseiarcus sp.]
MTIHARNIAAASPVGLDKVFGVAEFRKAASPAPARPAAGAPSQVNVNGPSLVVVVPDHVDAVLGVCSAAGLKGGSKLLWTLGLLALVAL